MWRRLWHVLRLTRQHFVTGGGRGGSPRTLLLRQEIDPVVALLSALAYHHAFIDHGGANFESVFHRFRVL